MYADFLRIVLEILNTVITAGLPHNPELVYALLHRQEVFAPFQARRCILRPLLCHTCSLRVLRPRRLTSPAMRGRDMQQSQ